jgi:hypothetical protein
MYSESKTHKAKSSFHMSPESIGMLHKNLKTLINISRFEGGTVSQPKNGILQPLGSRCLTQNILSQQGQFIHILWGI